MGWLGPPLELLWDTEGALKAKEAKVWLKRRGTERTLVPKQSHLNLVEKRGDLLKTTMRILKTAAEAEGLDALFREAGFEWREPGCSMCLAMNPDRLEGRQISASSSNRNFKGRQGSASGRTLLMSPAMVAAAAVHGRVTDVRSLSLQPAS